MRSRPIFARVFASARNRALALLFGCALSALACSSETARPSHASTVRVESDPGVPLANVSISADGRRLGTTDASGLLTLALSGAPGSSVPITVSCPPGYRSPREPLAVLLRPLPAGSAKPEYRVTCRPELRSLVISVRAQNGADLPLKYLGKEIARTDDQGAAHALLKVAPGESVNLVLDTSAPEAQQLRPQNPELRVTVPERDDIVVFEQSFTLPKAKPAKRAKREPQGPVRI
jgi:hypothetical protein